MKDHELGYLAGFLDGEGSIMIIKRPFTDSRGVNARRSATYMLTVQICNQYLPVLKWMKENFGGSIAVMGRAYTWVATANKALTFLEAVRPYVQIKRAQIELAIDFQTFKAGRRQYCGRNLTAENFELFDRFKEAMHLLNMQVKQVFYSKSGELLEPLTGNAEGNQQPSSSNDIEVGEKVQRLTGEESTNNPDTSARPERDDIVRYSGETQRSQDKELVNKQMKLQTDPNIC
jgi:hypothetical protein